VRITRFGGPEVLDVVDLPDPVPAGGQPVFDVSTAGVDHADPHHPAAADRADTWGLSKAVQPRSRLHQRAHTRSTAPVSGPFSTSRAGWTGGGAERWKRMGPARQAFVHFRRRCCQQDGARAADGDDVGVERVDQPGDAPTEPGAGRADGATGGGPAPAGRANTCRAQPTGSAGAGFPSNRAGAPPSMAVPQQRQGRTGSARQGISPRSRC
jgi:hypothetical protein